MSAANNHLKLDELLPAERILLDVTIAGLENQKERKDEKQLQAIARSLKILGLKSIHLINLIFQKKCGKAIATEQDYQCVSETEEERTSWKQEDSFSEALTAFLKELKAELKKEPNQEFKRILESIDDKYSSLAAPIKLENQFKEGLDLSQIDKLIGNWKEVSWAEQMRYNEEQLEREQLAKESEIYWNTKIPASNQQKFSALSGKNGSKAGMSVPSSDRRSQPIATMITVPMSQERSQSSDNGPKVPITFADIETTKETLPKSSSNYPEEERQVEKEEYNDSRSETMNYFLFPEYQALLDELKTLDQLNLEDLEKLNRRRKEQFVNDCAPSTALTVLKKSSSNDLDPKDCACVLEAMDNEKSFSTASHCSKKHCKEDSDLNSMESIFQRVEKWNEQNWAEKKKKLESRSEEVNELVKNWKKENRAEERRDNEERLKYLQKRHKVMKSAIETAVENIETMKNFVLPEYQALLDELKALDQLNLEDLDKLDKRRDEQLANECALSTSSVVTKDVASEDLDAKTNDEWVFVSDSEGQSSSEPTGSNSFLYKNTSDFLKKNGYQSYEFVYGTSQ
ncbi:Protein CBG27540 [Caenorhabditis briggsae]|uniref:Protein CBG27540 n=1 Tax=Caenorhabditis briggsae TaxID=6238 RepID=B6IKK1_CAEBR|nr:Protein CBG27540 [Caenorhabditis briggsae]CAS00431.1 Protein CBG27540 [Caenorhabditis briggsae]